MTTLFAPFRSETPQVFEIKGHRILFVSDEADVLTNSLEKLGADTIAELSLDEGSNEDDLLEDLAQRISGGVILTPAGVSIDTLIESLEQQLPWIH